MEQVSSKEYADRVSMHRPALNMATRFEYNGKMYSMTEQEIEAAYVYRTQQYMLSDARMHLNTVAFGCANASCIYSTETLEEEKQKFLGNYGITFEEASSPKMLERFIDKYTENWDSNESDYGMWQHAIKDVLKEGAAR